MGLLDKFLDAIKLNDDYDDDEEFVDDDESTDSADDYKEEKPKKRFFQKFKEEDDLGDEDDLDEDDSEASAAPANPFRRKEQKTSFADDRKTADDRKERMHAKDRPVKKNKITPMRRKGSGMEVNVIRPVSMEDTREIADTLLDSCTVVLNLEGLDVDIAQRIIDFTCGACYSLQGSLQKISSYIFILTPENVDISGDFQSILNGAFNDIPSMKTQY